MLHQPPVQPAHQNPPLPGAASVRALDAAVTAYNRCDPATTPLASRLALLHTVLGEVYAWYNGQQAYDWEALGNAAAAELREVRAVQAAAERHHETLVSAAVAADETPMVRSALPDQSLRDAATAVWRDVVGAKPVLAIEGTDAHRARTLSRLARIVETPTGVRLLRALIERRRPITLTAGIPERWRPFILEPAKPESMAHPQIAWSPHRSYFPPDANQRLQWTKDLTLLTAVPAGTGGDPPGFRRVTSAAELMRAAVDGVAGVVVPVADGPLNYGFGSGAYGSVVNLDPGDDDLAGRNGRVIHTPEWLTLAHELGHALNQVMGSATFIRAELFAALLPGVPDPGTTWTNPEELVVIEGVENPIRREVGLTERGRHSPALDPALNGRVTAAKNALQNLIPRVPDADDQQRLFTQSTSEYAKLQGQSPGARRAWCQASDQLIAELTGKYRLG